MHTGDQSKPEKEKGEYQETYGETEANKTKFVKLQAPYFDTQKRVSPSSFYSFRERKGWEIFWEIHSGVRESRV